jgi:hypothetical protein
MCWVDYGEDWDVFREETRTARKAYKCCECGRTIEPGEPYQYASGKPCGYDSWETYHTCQHCAAGPCRWLMATCGGYLYHGVYEDLDEHRQESDVRDIVLYRFLIAMRRKWRKRDGSPMAVPT